MIGLESFFSNQKFSFQKFSFQNFKAWVIYTVLQINLLNWKFFGKTGAPAFEGLPFWNFPQYVLQNSVKA